MITADVVIIGCGPTGVVLATLLGQLGVKVVVVEREPGVMPIPRATHIDEETLRNFQMTGLMPRLQEHTCPFGSAEVADERGQVLFEQEISDPAAPHGYRGSRFFDQAAFERALREGLGRYPGVRLLTGVAASGVENLADRVVVSGTQGATPVTIEAAWAVGCDGGRSLCREAMSVGMDCVAPKRHWMIVDTLLRDPADAALLPGRFRYVLDPRRLTIFAHGIGLNRRWEFELDEGEELPDEATVRRWIAPYIDPARLTILRTVKYSHNSLVATAWRAGRLLLAGDAAHMMPPSAGQGMCSGVRDAVNLAWKLGAVLGGADPSLLDTYETERSTHVREILAATLYISRRTDARTGWQRWQRRNVLRLATALPPLKAMMRRRGVARPPLRGGCLDETSALRGQHLPQVPALLQGGEALLDDLIGYRPALVARPGVLTEADLDWARRRGVSLWRPGVELLEPQYALARWLRDARVDFALARPDRIVFGAGDAASLPRVRGAFDRWLGG